MFAVVLTVRVEGVPGLTDVGLNKQVGNGDPPPLAIVTAHVRLTELLKPFTAFTLIAEVADPPGAAMVADVGVPVSVKPGVVLAVTVKVT